MLYEKTHYVSWRALERLIKFDPENHCISCHEDMDEGEYASELDGMELGFTKDNKERYAEVCCSMSIAFELWHIKARRKLRGSHLAYLQRLRISKINNSEQGEPGGG